MVDMHMHTTYSDGDKSLEYVLKKCEEKKLEVISITDHNTCLQYKDELLINNKIFSGKIIIGSELMANLPDGKRIEILAYNIKHPEIIDEWSRKYFNEDVLRREQEDAKRILLEACDKNGIIYDMSKVKIDVLATDYITVYIVQEILRHKENYEKLGELAESVSVFIRKGLMNPDSDYCTINTGVDKPMYEDVVDVIHKAGALAFLAHPFEYRFEDTIGFINELRKKANLDGIECFHPSAESENKIEILLEYARKNNLYISGGSDFHGDKKPNIDIGVGAGTLNISKKYIEEWI